MEQRTFDGIEPGDYRTQVSAPGCEDELYPGIITAQASDVPMFVTPALHPMTGVEQTRPASSRTKDGLLLVGSNPVRATARTIHQGLLSAGRYAAVWDGNSIGGRRVANGVYFYHLDVPCGRGIQRVVPTAR